MLHRIPKAPTGKGEKGGGGGSAAVRLNCSLWNRRGHALPAVLILPAGPAPDAASAMNAHSEFAPRLDLINRLIK